MKITKRLAALLGAGALVIAMSGTALAATPASDEGFIPTTVDPGNIKLVVTEGNQDQADCAADDGIETLNSGGEGTTANGVTVTWTYDSDTKEFGFSADGGLVTKAYVKGGNAYNVYNYTLEAGGGIASDGGMFAPDTNDDDKPQGLSHAVFCTVAVEESFEGSVDVVTDAPTDTINGSRTSGPADGAWLLVVALGVLLASIVVLTPARAKSRR